LHVHPCWLHFCDQNWAVRADAGPPSDSCAGRTTEEMVDIIERGLDPFRRWGVPPPVALRTGNLQADRTVYAAMSRVGLRLASNIGCAIYRPSEPDLQISAGRRWIGDVLEVPVLSYTQLALGGWKAQHLATITGTGGAELVSVLEMARAGGISPVVILTHPFEYIKGDTPGGEGCVANRINQRRFESVCRFIRENADRFAAVSFREAAPRWLSGGNQDARELRAPFFPVIRRIFENKVNDHLRFI